MAKTTKAEEKDVGSEQGRLEWWPVPRAATGVPQALAQSGNPRKPSYFKIQHSNPGDELKKKIKEKESSTMKERVKGSTLLSAKGLLSH